MHFVKNSHGKKYSKKTFVHFLKIYYTLLYGRATLEYSC